MNKFEAQDTGVQDADAALVTERDRIDLEDAGVLRRLRGRRAAAYLLITEIGSGVASIATGLPDYLEAMTFVNVILVGTSLYDLQNNRTASYEAITQPTRFFTKPDDPDRQARLSPAGHQV